MDINDIFSHFSDIFGDMGFGGFGGFSGGRRGAHPQHRGGDLRLKVKLSLQEIAAGVVKKFKVRKNVTCTECHGTGCETGHSAETCKTCNGSGYVVRSQRSFLGMVQTQEVCPTCGGDGMVISHKCKKCHGEGVVPGEEIVEIEIPAGVAAGMVVNAQGKGHAARRGGIPGNLSLIHI